MILNLDVPGILMKRVFDLSVELKKDSRTVELAQALTLNKDKPLLGLKGTFGLYASDEWWESIRTGRMKTEIVSGVIDRTYFAGQDSRWGDEINSFVLRLADETSASESIYVQEKRDKKLFKPGARVQIAYAFDELKIQPNYNEGTNYLRQVLEMAVSI